MKYRIFLTAAVLGLFLLSGPARSDEACEQFIAGLLPANVDKGNFTCDYISTMGMSHLQVKANWGGRVWQIDLEINKYLPSFPNWQTLKNAVYQDAKEKYDKDVKEWTETEDEAFVKYGPNESKAIMDGRSFCQKITRLPHADGEEGKNDINAAKTTTDFRCRYLVTSEGVVMQMTISEKTRAKCDEIFTKAREKAKKM